MPKLGYSRNKQFWCFDDPVGCTYNITLSCGYELRQRSDCFLTIFSRWRSVPGGRPHDTFDDVLMVSFSPPWPPTWHHGLASVLSYRYRNSPTSARWPVTRRSVIALRVVVNTAVLLTDYQRLDGRMSVAGAFLLSVFIVNRAHRWPVGSWLWLGVDGCSVTRPIHWVDQIASR